MRDRIVRSVRHWKKNVERKDVYEKCKSSPLLGVCIYVTLKL